MSMNPGHTFDLGTTECGTHPRGPNCPSAESSRKGQQNQRLSDKLSAPGSRYERPARE